MSDVRLTQSTTGCCILLVNFSSLKHVVCLFCYCSCYFFYSLYPTSATLLHYLLPLKFVFCNHLEFDLVLLGFVCLSSLFLVPLCFVIFYVHPFSVGIDNQKSLSIRVCKAC
ncbi:hypothetical protein GDO81_006729 [Engystomops pustulosus]|uniref:Uncharacterized protein n=1 Tax=Engystomops pustulosus TaxID=76066 RepID=A0AAV7D0R4_ENGPU|nr:hypothetical protein GDO81_006729 [Engystomops pustulosus]